jgi:hypothetical protein
VSARRRRAATAFALAAAAIAFALVIPAVAQATETNVQATEATPPALSRRSVKLFDMRRSILSYGVDVGPIWFRQARDRTPDQAQTGFERGGGEIALGQVTTTPVRPFYIMGTQKTLFRVLSARSFSWSLFQQELGGGLILGPFEPEVRFGVSVLTADTIRGDLSAQFFSPRASVGMGLHLGRIRLDIKAHTEYLWRWFGPDYVLRGLTLGVRLDVPRGDPFAPKSGAAAFGPHSLSL